MAQTPEHAPRLSHTPIPDFRGAARWALSHWKPVGLSLATLAGGTYFAIAHDRGPDTSPVSGNAPASDTFKPPEGGSNVGVVTNPVEPTATAEAQKTPTPNPDEERGIVGYNVFSLETRAATKASEQYLEWNSPKGNKIKGIGWVLKPEDVVKINGGLIVSVKILEQPYVYSGVMVLADTPDGSRSYLLLGNFDKNNLSKGILTIAKDGPPVFNGEPYTFAYATESEAELKGEFPESTKTSPKEINNKVPENQANNTAVSYPKG